MLKPCAKCECICLLLPSTCLSSVDLTQRIDTAGVLVSAGVELENWH